MEYTEHGVEYVSEDNRDICLNCLVMCQICDLIVDPDDIHYGECNACISKCDSCGDYMTSMEYMDLGGICEFCAEYCEDCGERVAWIETTDGKCIDCWERRKENGI